MLPIRHGKGWSALLLKLLFKSGDHPDLKKILGFVAEAIEFEVHYHASKSTHLVILSNLTTDTIEASPVGNDLSELLMDLERDFQSIENLKGLLEKLVFEENADHMLVLKACDLVFLLRVIQSIFHRPSDSQNKASQTALLKFRAELENRITLKRSI